MGIAKYNKNILNNAIIYNKYIVEGFVAKKPDENKKLYKYIQCISLHHDKCKNEDKNSGYCITKCVHNDIKKCKDFIKDYNLKCSLLHTEIQMLRVATFTEKSKTF